MKRLALAVCVAALTVAAALSSCGIPPGVYFLCEEGGVCSEGFECVNRHCLPLKPRPDGGDAGDDDAGEDAGETDAGETDAGGDDGGEPDGGSDDGGIDAGAVVIVPVPETWINAAAITELNTPATEWMPTVTPDELKICFGTSRASPTQDIWCAEREDPGAPFNSPAQQTLILPNESIGNPEISSDGTELFFTGLDGGSDYTDLFVSEFAGVNFVGKQWVGNVAGPYYDVAPSLTGDGLTLYFQSDRNLETDRDIWVSTRPNLKGLNFSPPQRLPDGVNSPDQESSPAISPDGGYLVFTSENRDAGALTGAVIWIATRHPDGGWAPARPVVIEGITTPVDDLELAGDDTLYFQTRPGGPTDDRELYRAEPRYPTAE